MSEEEFNFDEQIREVIKFEMILPPRYRDDLEVLILISQDCWFRLRDIAYRHGVTIDFNHGTMFGLKYSIDLGMTGYKFNPVFQRKVKWILKN